MRKLVIWGIAVMAIVASAAIANAAENVSAFSIGLSHGTSAYSPPSKSTGDDYAILTPIDEIGVNADFSWGLAEDYAFALSGDYRFGSSKLEPNANATPGSPVLKLTSTSWKFRVGADRTGKIGDRFKWYMGPGLEYASGKAKYKDFAAPPDDDVESEPANRFGLSGRVGGVMMLSPQMGIRGQIGDTFGMESVDDNGGKSSQLYSSFEGAWGLQFTFGNK